MRLAAIYINDHEYLFNEPQTINFGGRYYYNFTVKNNIVTINRIQNHNFIEGFFDLTKTDSKITSINAIVGQNGAGKSSLLDVIRSEFVEHEYSLPQTTSLFLVEVDNNEYPLILRNDFKKDVFLQLTKEDKAFSKTRGRIKLNDPIPKKTRTIYYSPHFDYKFNLNFDNIDDHDISFDKILELDLNELSEKDVNESGWEYSPNQELLFKNSLRQIEFLSSDLVKTHSIFKNIFYLPEHGDPILTFRGYKPREKDWNTPNAFRSAMRAIEQKIEKEIRAWGKIRKIENEKVLNQVEINQYILKRNILKDILSLLYKQMEKNNAYLTNGNFPTKKFEQESKGKDALGTFLIFIENCFVGSSKRNKRVKVFKGNSVKELLEKTYKAIEKTTDKDSVSNDTLKVSKEDAIEILNLQKLFLHELYNYYHLLASNVKDTTLSNTDRIEGFINYMPFSQKLSSGENALLNLFSRLYDFINSNLKRTNRFYKVRDHYILLLDEADLGFHPTWKKRYVKALISTIPYFFNELENKPSIQIIFTTHDPLTLSDLPNSNVIYIEKSSYDVKPKVLDYNSTNRPLKTFGANISDLLADSFFLEESLIGDFAYEIIHKTIEWLNDKNNSESSDYYKKIIRIIDEPIIQRKLAEMYDDKINEKFQLSIVNEQIEKLQNLKKRLK